MFCASCGTRLGPAAQYCEECGAACPRHGAPQQTPRVWMVPGARLTGALVVQESDARSRGRLALNALWWLMTGLWLSVILYTARYPAPPYAALESGAFIMVILFDHLPRLLGGSRRRADGHREGRPTARGFAVHWLPLVVRAGLAVISIVLLMLWLGSYHTLYPGYADILRPSGVAIGGGLLLAFWLFDQVWIALKGWGSRPTLAPLHDHVGVCAHCGGPLLQSTRVCETCGAPGPLLEQTA